MDLAATTKSIRKGRSASTSHGQTKSVQWKIDSTILESTRSFEFDSFSSHGPCARNLTGHQEIHTQSKSVGTSQVCRDGHARAVSRSADGFILLQFHSLQGNTKTICPAQSCASECDEQGWRSNTRYHHEHKRSRVGCSCTSFLVFGHFKSR